LTTRKRINLLTIGFAIFWFVYTLILVSELLQSRKLIPVEGELISAMASYRNTPGWQAHSRPHWDLDVKYVYHFNGATYEGWRFRIDGNSAGLESIAIGQAKELVAKGKYITIWVDPSRPEHSVLERNVGLQAWLFWWLLAAITGLIHQLFTRKTSRTTS